MTKPNNFAPAVRRGPAVKILLLAVGIALGLWGVWLYRGYRYFDERNVGLLWWPPIVAGWLLMAAVALRGFRWLGSREAARLLARGGVALLSLIVLYYNFQAWSGKRAWLKLKQEAAVRGDTLAWSDVIQYAAKTPALAASHVFAPLFDYTTNAQGELTWRQPAARDRLLAVTAQGAGERRFRGGAGLKSAPGWARQEITDLGAWQAYYRQRTKVDRFSVKRPGFVSQDVAPDFPVPATPGEPAADVLMALGKYDEVLRQIHADLTPASFRFPVGGDQESFARLPHAELLSNLARVLRLRAGAALALGRTDQALADIDLLLRLADAVREEPFFETHLVVRSRLLNHALQPVWEGLAGRRWSEAQLLALQGRFSRIDLLADYAVAVKGQAYLHMDLPRMLLDAQAGHFPPDMLSADPWEHFWTKLFVNLYPSGWAYQNRAGLYRLYRDWSLPLIDPPQRRVHVERARDFDRAAARMTPDPWFRVFVEPRVKQLLQDTAETFAFFQTSADQAALACALERYRLARGQYPEALAALAPQFLERVPRDVITGDPLPYRRLADGGFVLYSVGWNERDDGGTAAPIEPGGTTGLNLTTGDWVWKYPAGGPPSSAAAAAAPKPGD